MHHAPAVAVVANLVVLGTLGYAAATLALAPDFYYRSVQEDEYLEWTSFWVFVLAGFAFVAAAVGSRRSSGRVPWFQCGVALFCGFVALEEISWGQRLLGYRPPAYFLEHNYQQELNVHNVVADGLRQAAFQAVVLGYGVLLPLAFLMPAVRRLLEPLGVRAPSPLLLPAFLATGVLYHVYPWSHTGEWAELMLGSSMLFTALIQVGAFRAAAKSAPRVPLSAVAAIAWLAAVLLGAGTSFVWWALASDAPERLETARHELAALRRDIGAARTKTRCGIHKRLYSLVEAYDLRHLTDGEFAALRALGLPEERGEFFLDPWNSPYWFRHVCSQDRTRRAIYVYSFGPNRRRDSMPWEIVEDDVVAWVSRPAPAPAD